MKVNPDRTLLLTERRTRVFTLNVAKSKRSAEDIHVATPFDENQHKQTKSARTRTKVIYTYATFARSLGGPWTGSQTLYSTTPPMFCLNIQEKEIIRPRCTFKGQTIALFLKRALFFLSYKEKKRSR